VILQMRDLGKTFETGKHRVAALSAVSLDVSEGECLAVVGESGSGKSTLGNLILGLFAPTTGHIVFDGSPLLAPRSLEQRRAPTPSRWREHPAAGGPRLRLTGGG
jgi:ABC-type oligopeptide transport system ATPase subunit